MYKVLDGHTLHSLSLLYKYTYKECKSIIINSCSLFGAHKISILTAQSRSFPPNIVRVLVSPTHALFFSPEAPFKCFLCFHTSQSHFTILIFIHYLATLTNHVYVFPIISCSFFEQQQPFSKIYSYWRPKCQPF
jgi:hypothetical protein